MPGTFASSRSSPSSTANGSSPTASRAHSTACPRPRASPCRTDKNRASSVGLRTQRQVVGLAALLEQRLELGGAIEVVLDRRLAARGDEDDLLDARRHALLDDDLDAGHVDQRQHLLRHRLGRRQEPRSKSRHRQHCLAPSFLGHGVAILSALPAAPQHGPESILVDVLVDVRRRSPPPPPSRRPPADLGDRLVQRRRDLLSLGQLAQRARRASRRGISARRPRAPPAGSALPAAARRARRPPAPRHRRDRSGARPRYDLD